MKFRKFKADQLFTGYKLLSTDSVLITDETGRVEDIVQISEAGDDVEVLSGILSPGLINCHCHLELSHLKDVIPPHTGLIDFLCSVVTKRDFAAEIISDAIVRAENEMYNNGIVAVGDIGNTADTVAIKSNNRIRWHNFIEVLSFTDERSASSMEHYSKVLQIYLEKLPSPHRSVLTAHAPYSISPKTFEAINALTGSQIISIHNQEHPAENELYRTGGGDYLQFFKIFGVDKSPFPVTGKGSLPSYLPWFKNGQTIFLIHNTYMPEEDLIFAQQYAKEHQLDLVFCLCVNANLYIENKVPPIEMFMKHHCNLVLGTDSYSSNWQLSIAKEIASIRKYFPQIPPEIILQWATINGAKALQWDNDLGSFEKGKTPGIVLIKNDFESSRRIL